MKQASAKDDLLSSLCTWCGQAGCQVWCKDMACGQSADMPTSSYRCFLDSQVVHMKQASTFDVQLSPGCPWCGQVGNQVWCNEFAMWRRAEGAGPAAAGAHSRSHCRCVLKGSWVYGSFFGYGCHQLLLIRCLVMRLSLCWNSCTLYPSTSTPRAPGRQAARAGGLP